MFEIGASLVAARHARGLELRDAERLTCMRTKYLLALEADRFDQLPGRTYARTFLRTYATLLGLDADQFVAEFDEQVPEPDAELPTEQIPRPARRLPLSAAAVAMLVAVAVIVVIAAWSQWSGQSPPQPAAAASSRSAPPIRPAPQHHVKAARKTIAQTTPPLVVRAVHGPCWILARRGGPTGAVLAEETLQQGETARFAAGHVWLRLGAPWNVSVQRGSHRVSGLPSGVPANLTA